MTENLTLAYLVCATPRSGSTLLCEMLRATGHAGQPLEHFEHLLHSGLPRQPREYFEGLESPEVLDLLAPIDPGSPSTEPAEQWWARILREGRSANGVWGGKLMWGHTEDLVARARQLDVPGVADLDDALTRVLGEPRLILASREDKVAQAVSLWRAVQTQRWRGGEASAHEPQYSFDGIDHLRRRLEREERAWREWFGRTGREPFEVPYRRLDTAPREAVDEVLAWLGLQGVQAPEPPLQRQRDELSEGWAERYRGELRAVNGDERERAA